MRKTHEILEKHEKEIRKPTEILKKHAEEMEWRFINSENIIIGRNQVKEMELKAVKKDYKNLEDLMIEIKLASESRDKILDDKIHEKIKSASV